MRLIKSKDYWVARMVLKWRDVIITQNNNKVGGSAGKLPDKKYKLLVRRSGLKVKRDIQGNFGLRLLAQS